MRKLSNSFPWSGRQKYLVVVLVVVVVEAVVVVVVVVVVYLASSFPIDVATDGYFDVLLKNDTMENRGVG